MLLRRPRRQTVRLSHQQVAEVVSCSVVLYSGSSTSFAQNARLSMLSVMPVPILPLGLLGLFCFVAWNFGTIYTQVYVWAWGHPEPKTSLQSAAAKGDENRVTEILRQSDVNINEANAVS